uniref:Calsyntenin C-terminal domain-containing protein n=1 Tax=Ditylenchus dipsaci TaxID=166011 RepID=A0A915DJJ1_9BILA
MDLPRPKALLSHHGYEVGSQGAVAGGAVAVVVVICIGFLLVLLVIGVIKMRDSPLPVRRRNRKTTIEAMEWDDQGMNITVIVSNFYF